MSKLLIVDDDDGLIHFLERLFGAEYELASCGDGASALRRLAGETFDAILLDYRMPGLNGLETLEEIKRMRVRTPVIVMTAHGTTETAIEAMKLGAYDYLLKPFDTDELRRVVADAVEVHDVMKQIVAPAPGAGRIVVAAADAEPDRIVGAHRKMQEVFKLIGQVAARDVTVLVTGESGTGKELVARAIHRHSHRRDGPFTAVNCAAIPEALFESELFGHEQGAFTGADRLRAGRLERSAGGTLFFDEIGDMSPGTQAKILRVLQEGEFERLGGSETLRADVRVIAATNKDLETETAARRFRQDLYYRLKIISIHLPPLRERLDDVPALVSHFVARFAAADHKPVRFVAEETIARLRSHSWPGNVRELENCLRRAVLVCKGDVLLPEHVRFEDGRGAEGREGPAAGAMLGERVEVLAREVLLAGGSCAHASLIDLVEESLVAEALRACGGNQVHAARRLGISRNTLRSRMKRYGMIPPRPEKGTTDGHG
jgi:two-component system, NtrC family, response regulator AtoC